MTPAAETVPTQAHAQINKHKFAHTVTHCNRLSPTLLRSTAENSVLKESSGNVKVMFALAHAAEISNAHVLCTGTPDDSVGTVFERNDAIVLQQESAGDLGGGRVANLVPGAPESRPKTKSKSGT